MAVALGRRACVSRRAVPSRTYDDDHTYVRTASYDHGGRPTAMTLPTDPDFDGTAPEIGGSLEYNARGLPSRVNLLVDEGSRAIVDELVYTRDGLVEQVTYGDDLEGDGVSSRTPTVSFTTYDDRRRPIRMRTERATNSHGELGEDRPLEDVTEPHNQMLVWDLADNLIAIEDLRDPTEWPDGFRPQSVHVTHDSLYRVAGAEYEYTQDSGTRTAVDDTSASNDWRTEMAAGRTNDPMRTAPAPLMADEPDQRVVSMTWAHDWLGNMQAWDDDSAVFYERSLGDIVNGADLPTEAPSRRTGALYVASNLPETPVTADDGGWVEVRYGEDGNALSVTVHGRCGDPTLNSIALDCRTETDDPEEAVDLSCAYSCATEQHYTYAWDEVNRIALARRLDREDGGDWELAVEQRYLYDASNQRTLKTTTFRGAESGTERTALYVYPGDFQRRGLVASMSGTSYDAVSGDTETQYGVGGARIVWRDGDRDDTLDRDQRVTISLTDLIQSTTAVIDLARGELVESGSYYANGARETYRSNETETVTPEPMGFTGKEADEEVGLTYFGHRYLMAHLGRWASPDPLQTHAVGGGEAVNGYHYVAGNLLRARDVAGLRVTFVVAQVRTAGGARVSSSELNRSEMLQTARRDFNLQLERAERGFFSINAQGELGLTASGRRASRQGRLSPLAEEWAQAVRSREEVYLTPLRASADLRQAAETGVTVSFQPRRGARVEVQWGRPESRQVGGTSFGSPTAIERDVFALGIREGLDEGTSRRDAQQYAADPRFSTRREGVHFALWLTSPEIAAGRPVQNLFHEFHEHLSRFVAGQFGLHVHGGATQTPADRAMESAADARIREESSPPTPSQPTPRDAPATGATQARPDAP